MPKITEYEALEPPIEEEEKEEESPTKKAKIRRNLSVHVNSTVKSDKLNRNFSTPHLRPIQLRQESMKSTESKDSLKSSCSKIARPMSRIDIFYTGSIRNIDDEDFDDIETVGLRPNQQSYVSIGGMKGSHSSQVFPRNSLLDTSAVEHEEKEEDTGIVSVLKTMLNPSILKILNSFYLVSVMCSDFLDSMFPSSTSPPWHPVTNQSQMSKQLFFFQLLEFPTL